MATGAIVLALGFGGTTGVFAASVMATPRPDYDPKGMPFGGFRLFPTLMLSESFDDNVYRTQTGTKSSFLFSVAPQLVLASQWSRHELDLSAGVDYVNYSKLSPESHTDWFFAGNGRIDIMRGADIKGSARYSSLHEARTSPDLVGFAAKPTSYSVLHGEATIEDQPNRFSMAAGVTADRYNYQITDLVGGGTLSNNDRDRTIYTVFGKVGYEFSPGYAAFVRGAYNNDDFRLNVDRTGVNRDSNGYTLDAGVDMMVTNLVKGQIFIGYLDQRYKAPLGDVTGFNYGVGLEWYATPLLTINLAGARRLSDTTIAGAAAEDDRLISAGFDYEFRPNVLIRGNASYTNSDFSGAGRTDNTTDAWIGFRYLLNRYMNADAKYEYSRRSTNIVGQDYDDNLFMIGLNLQE